MPNPFRDQIAYISPVEASLFTITGRDAKDYLHRQLSNEIRNLQVGEGTPTCLLSREGKIILFFYLYSTSEGYDLLVWGEQANLVIPNFEKYIFREKVQITNKTESVVPYLIAGKNLKQLVNLPDREFGTCYMEVAGQQMNLYLTDWLSIPCGILFCPQESTKSVNQYLLDRNVKETKMENFHVLRIEHGTPWPGFEINEEMNPFECGLEKAISLTKGCYVGQEIIARIFNLGQPSRLLRGLIMEDETIPPVGQAVIHEGIEVGVVSSAGYSDILLRGIATSSIRRKFCEAGGTFQIGNKTAVLGTFPLV